MKQVSQDEAFAELGRRESPGLDNRRALRRDIVTQFLIATTLCAIGGVIGVTVSISIGPFIGIYPMKAASLDPIEALRYE